MRIHTGILPKFYTLENMKFLKLLFTAMFYFFISGWQMSHDFKYLGQHIEIFMKKVKCTFAFNLYRSESAGSGSVCPGCRSWSWSVIYYFFHTSNSSILTEMRASKSGTATTALLASVCRSASQSLFGSGNTILRHSTGNLQRNKHILAVVKSDGSGFYLSFIVGIFAPALWGLEM